MKNIKKLAKTVLTTCLVATMLISTDFSASAATETVVEKEYLLQTEDLANVTVINGDWKLENDVFSLTKKAEDEAGWCQAFIGSEEWTDYVIEFDLIQAIDGGVWFRASDDGNGLDAYMLGSDGLYIYLAKATDGVFATMADPSQAVAGGKPFATQYNKMWDAHWKLVVEGNVFSVYLEGETEPAIQATDSDFASGFIGFNYNAALNGEPSTEITNFEVYKEVEKTVEVEDEPKDNTQDETGDTQDKADAAQAGKEEPSDSKIGLVVGIVIATVVVIGAVSVIVVVNKKKKSAK